MIADLLAAAVLFGGAPTLLPGALTLPNDLSAFEAVDRAALRAGLLPPSGVHPRRLDDLRLWSAGLPQTSWTPADRRVIDVHLFGAPRALGSFDGLVGSRIVLRPRAELSARHDDTPPATGRVQARVGGEAAGALGGEVAFRTDAWIFTEWADSFAYYDRWAQADGQPSGVPFGKETRDGRFSERTGARYTATVAWSRDWIALRAGRDHVQHGPGLWTGLTTDRHTPPLQMIDAEWRAMRWLRVRSTVLEARPAEPAPGRDVTWDARKIMYVHRWEVHALPGLRLGLQNAVIHRDSIGAKTEYLLPLVPLFFVQELAGNRDNASMQFDLEAVVARGVGLWAAWNIDDLNSLSDAAGDHWLNRWALLVGGRILSPWSVLDADIAMEHVAVRPWTFTDVLEPNFSFVHQGLPLGTGLGPDSRATRLRLSVRPLPSLAWNFEGRLEEKGTGPGAIIGSRRPVGAPEHARFLEGPTDRRRRLGMGVTYTPYPDMALHADLGRRWTRDSANVSEAAWEGGASVRLVW